MLDSRYVGLMLTAAMLVACGKSADADARATKASASVLSDAPAIAATADVVPSEAFPVDNADVPAAEPTSAQTTTSLRASFGQCTKEAGGVDIAMQDCISAEYSHHDDRLNAAYAQLKRKLSAERMTALRNEQRQWLRDRDSQCIWDAKTEGSAQRLQANYCLMERTAKRADELESMVRGGAPSAAIENPAPATASASLDA